MFTFVGMGQSCNFYIGCGKPKACELLGQCIFNHAEVVKSTSAQAIIQLHHADTIGAMNNVLGKLKKGQRFKQGKEVAAINHLSLIKHKIKNRYPF